MVEVSEVKQRVQSALSIVGSNPTQLAKLFKVNQKTLNNQINGTTDLSVSTILLILEAFPQISADWLLLGTGKMEKQDVADLVEENKLLQAKIDGMVEMAKAFGLNVPVSKPDIEKAAV